MTLDAFFTSRGIRYKTKPNGFQLCCVACSDSRYRLGVSTSKGVAHCFNCYRSWRLSALLRELGAADSVLLFASAFQHAQEKPVDLPKGFTLLSGLEQGALGKIYAYGVSRGITPAQFYAWRIGGVVAASNVNKRLVFPVFSADRLYSWCARATDGAEPKYLMAPGGKRALWGSIKPTTVIAEGTLKALAIERAVATPTIGYAASLGNMMTEFQIEQCSDGGCNEIVYYPDPLSGPSLDGLVATYALAKDYGIRLYAPENFPVHQADDATPKQVMRALDSIQLVTPGLLAGWREKCHSL
jgi:hypothetical protein